MSQRKPKTEIETKESEQGKKTVTFLFGVFQLPHINLLGSLGILDFLIRITLLYFN